MNREVTVTGLREHVDDVLRSIRNGNTITIVEDDVPLAEIIPSERPARPAGRLGDYRPQSLRVDFDPLEDLLEDRRKR